MPSNARSRVAQSFDERKAIELEDYTGQPVQEIYGELVFNDEAQRKFLSKDVYKKLRATVDRGEIIDVSIADQVAQGMREWAMEHGASHYTHWFIPMTGGSAEKHDAMLEPQSDGRILMEFTGAQLIQGEPDASSFPSGGLRVTFEARGYTAWDPTSPAFLMKEANGATLYIPTAFMSYTGEALDYKTPLLRSQDAMSDQALRILKMFGNTKSVKVFANVGPEQEYFLIDRKYFEQRPDLIATGRTLFGASPFRGQELEDHYFGSIRERILSFMQDLDRELWRYGIPAKTRHNEVAPAQFEIAPVFEKVSVTCDHNMLLMETLRRVALRHGLVALLHEKPFAGVNGSGKHNNWSMGTNDGENLLNPGHTPHDNAQFLTFLTATIRAVHKYNELMRVGISGAGNDHRLGANEAPPAIISVFLGEQLQDIVEQLIKGGLKKSKAGGMMELGVGTLPPLAMDTTDRNRTSPFAFTGNRFEIRALGSSIPAYLANTILNTAVAESLQYLADKLEKSKGSNFNSALTKLLGETLKEHKAVIFSGNNYSEEWHKEAAKRGLSNLKTTPDALKTMGKKEYKELFKKFLVLNSKEYDSREEIFWERYNKTLNIEALATLDIAKNMIYPAVLRYQGELARSIVATKQVTGKGQPGAESVLDMIAGGSQDLYEAIKALGEAHAATEAISSPEKQGFAYKDNIIPAMKAVRDVADKLETMVADDLWPLPKYREMLFQY